MPACRRRAGAGTWIILLSGAAALAGCAATGTAPAAGSDPSAGSGGATSSSSAAGGGGAGGSGVDFGTGGGAAGGPPAEGEVFAHSADMLFRLEPVSKEVSVVGRFSGCGDAVVDIAIDENGVMFGTTYNALYRIDKTTAACTFVTAGSYPNSLSFVPKGTLDPNEEALVGYQGASYVRIDTTTGAKSTVGELGGTYRSSGDVVSVIGGSTYLTVTGDDCDDCIVLIDPRTGAMERRIGALDRQDVFGLAFWGGAAYGFTSGGDLFQIDLDTAATSDITMPNAPQGLSFFGAGSTTAAPLEMPR